jgi:hypothetical protein
MNIEEYADALNLRIELTYYPNQGGRWSARFVGVEVKVDGALISAYGNGNGSTPEAALNDYVSGLPGNRIVIHAAQPERRAEYIVPESLQPC